jgi:dienelactone hydrolase
VARRRWFIWLVLVLALLAVGVFAFRRAADTHLRALSLLVRFSDPKADGFSTSFARQPIKEELGSAQTPEGPLKFRLYIPQGSNRPPAMLLLHGVHHLGMDEPRLVSFARALAGTGVEVMTPEFQDLADYRITPKTINVIGDAAVILSSEAKERVGVMGLSFAGGLALMSAARPEYAKDIAFVVAVGAHDDMTRVARFYADDEEERPDGAIVHLQAHEYGVLVLAYSHLDQFFSSRDLPAAQNALRQWLWEQPREAESTSLSLTPAGRAEFDDLIHHRTPVEEQIMVEIEKYRSEMDAVSPHGHLSQLAVPVFLLHGSGDTVIPSAETEWLAKDVPRNKLKAELISPALIHVSMEESVAWREKWALVDFLAQVLRAADRLEH